MKLHALFLAEDAEITGDTLRVAGGLWDGLNASTFPATHPLVLVALLRPDLEDVGQSSHLDFHVTGPDGRPAGHDHVDVTLNVYRRHIPVVVRVRGTFNTPGTYAVKLVSQVGTDTVSFDVVSASDSSPVARAVEGYALGLTR